MEEATGYNSTARRETTC